MGSVGVMNRKGIETLRGLTCHYHGSTSPGEKGTQGKCNIFGVVLFLFFFFKLTLGTEVRGKYSSRPHVTIAVDMLLCKDSIF